MYFGENGSGKSTLIRIILVLYIKEQKGTILYNNIPSRDINMMEIRRKKIAVCEHESFLLKESLLYNLTFDEEYKEFELKSYIEMLSLEKVINNLSDEPTSALDSRGRERFLNFLPKYKKDKIIIISTHDKDILEISDHILEFKQ